jgi:hypothetical protein
MYRLHSPGRQNTVWCPTWRSQYDTPVMGPVTSVSGKQRLHARPVVPFHHLEGKFVQKFVYSLLLMFYGCYGVV